MVHFTVAIPTYNSEKRLPILLEKLKNCIEYTQKIENISLLFEIIIVDNNSTDETAFVVQTYQENWHPNYPLRYCFEPKQGAAYARQRAVREAEGELIGLIDDDNLPKPDWVFQAYLFGKKHPKAGAYGGQIHANYEVNPPENFSKIEGFLAIRERGDRPNLYQPEILSLPPGAAMVVRRQAWLNCVPQRPKLGGKVGVSMVQGDDWEPLIYLYKAGWEIWYNPAMHTDHQIPAWRLEREYLLKLIHGSCLCFIPLKMMIAKPWKKPIILARTILGNTYKLILHVLKLNDNLKTDLVAACELQIYLSRILSVFYLFKKIQSG